MIGLARWRLIAPAAVVGVSATTFGLGCSGGQNFANCDGEACAAGAAGMPAEAGDRASTGGVGNSVAPPNVAGANAGELEPSCVPREGLDDPDAAFEDTNCDGIDGDVSRAVFVAPSGADVHSGTMDEPVRSVANAVRLAQASGKDVYLCNGTYAESILIEGARVNLYGGYDCANGWARSQKQAELAPETGVPLTIMNLSESMNIQRLKLSAPDAIEEGQSSVALFAVSARLSISRSTLSAASGQKGSAGASVQATTQTASAASGDSLVTTTCNIYAVSHADCGNVAAGGVASASYTCPTGGTVQGGKGGNGANWKTSIEAQKGSAGVPSAGATSGANGANGEAGADGEAATSGFGSVDERGGYQASNTGNAGTNGKPGQSGTGGIGGISRAIGSDPSTREYYYVGGGGGAGGRGGCGGLAGNGGGGGGASIAAVLLDSPAAFEWTEFRTATGGSGGPGSDGTAGQLGITGGLGGNGTCGESYCQGQDGGRGGNGGKGGAGGPGGGGPSIGIVARGIAPTVTASTFDIGLGGRGGTAVIGSGSSDAEDGLSTDVHVIDLAP